MDWLLPNGGKRDLEVTCFLGTGPRGVYPFPSIACSDPYRRKDGTDRPDYQLSLEPPPPPSPPPPLKSEDDEEESEEESEDEDPDEDQPVSDE